MHPKEDSMNSSLISRREAIQRVAAAAAIAYAAAPWPAHKASVQAALLTTKDKR